MEGEDGQRRKGGVRKMSRMLSRRVLVFQFGDRYRSVHTNSATVFRRSSCKQQQNVDVACAAPSKTPDSRTKGKSTTAAAVITYYAKIHRNSGGDAGRSRLRIYLSGRHGRCSSRFALIRSLVSRSFTGNNLLLKKRINMASKSAVDACVHSGGSIWYLAHCSAVNFVLLEYGSVSS